MTDADKNALVRDVYAAAGELLIAGVRNPSLRSCWPPEVRRQVADLIRRRVDDADLEREAKASIWQLVRHIIRGLQLRVIGAGGGGDEDEAERIVRQFTGAMRLAASGDEAAAAFVRNLLADAGDLAFVEAAVAAGR